LSKSQGRGRTGGTDGGKEVERQREKELDGLTGEAGF
jgi:hypothetical protein